MQTNTCQMKTNFAKFQEEQFNSRKKVAPVAKAEPKKSSDKSNDDVAGEAKDSKKK